MADRIRRLPVRRTLTEPAPTTAYILVAAEVVACAAALTLAALDHWTAAWTLYAAAVAFYAATILTATPTPSPSASATPPTTDGSSTTTAASSTEPEPSPAR